MVSGSARGGRGGGQIGRARAGALSAEEELESRYQVSDAARILGSYRYLRYRLQPTQALRRRESQHHRELEGLNSPASSSASCALPPRRLNFGEATNSRADDNEAIISLRPRPVPRFDPRDFVPDDLIPMVAAALERNAPALTAGDFVPEAALGTVTSLLKEKTLRDAKKAAEWRRTHEEQDAKFVELSDPDESD